MKLKPNLYILLFSLLLTSCGILWDYRETHEFETYIWNADETQNFEFEFSDNETHSLHIIGQHLTGIPYPNLDLTLKIEGDAYSNTWAISIPLRSANGDYLTQGSGDYWDFDYEVFHDQSLPKGKYAATLSSDMNVEEVKLITTIGILID